MCGRVFTKFEMNYLDLSLFDKPNIHLNVEPNYNQSPTENITILFYNIAQRKFEVTQAIWKLIPPNVKDIKTFPYATFNARGEDIFTKKSYSHAVLYSRCEILVSGFIEWHYYSKTDKQPYAISDQNDVITKLAGIYTIHNGKHTVSIVTVKANQLMSKIHNIYDINPNKSARMPLMLSGKNRYNWHNPNNRTFDKINPIINWGHSNDEIKWEAFKVDTSIGNARNKSPDLLTPIDQEIFKN